MNDKNTIDLFADLTPFQKWWEKLKGKTQAKIINFKNRIKRKVNKNE